MTFESPAEATGLEPVASCVTVRRSNLLSYATHYEFLHHVPAFQTVPMNSFQLV